jgi:PGF-CTERM protein
MNVYYGFTGPTWAGPDTSLSYTPAQAEALNPTNDDDIKVQVIKATVTFDIPSKVIIGEDLEIEGAISAGDTVNIVVKDERVIDWNEAVDEDNEFSVKWDTSGMTVGSYTIEAYIDFDKANPDLLASYSGVDSDGKTTIRLIEPGLTVEQVRNVIAEGDDYTLKGTATGVTSVDYVLVGPKGWKSGTSPSILSGLYFGSATVTDDEFEEDETMTDGLDTGLWVLGALHPGRDGTYEYPITIDGLQLSDGKSQSQILSILEDRVTAAGSDDVFKMLSFRVESGYVRLNPITTVGVGQPMNVTGVTNREPDTAITISTFQGPSDLLALTDVEWPTADQGVFFATIDTTDAKEGTYTLEADDGDGNTDTESATIGAAKPSPTATPAPTATPTPTVPATPTPATPTPATPTPATPTPEEPGFEAVFAIAGLLALAYLVLRIRK